MNFKFVFLLLILFVLVFSACGGGKASEAQAEFDDSVYYSAIKYAILLDVLEQKKDAENISSAPWQNTCNSLSLLFSDYGLKIENTIFPDVQLLCQAIFERPGDFIENTVQFLIDFDNCFSINYTFLQYEIDNWKDAFIEYITTWTDGTKENTLFFANFYTNRVNYYFNIYSYKDTFTINKSYEEILDLYGEALNIIFYDFNRESFPL